MYFTFTLVILAYNQITLYLWKRKEKKMIYYIHGNLLEQNKQSVWSIKKNLNYIERINEFNNNDNNFIDNFLILNNDINNTDNKNIPFIEQLNSKI